MYARENGVDDDEDDDESSFRKSYFPEKSFSSRSSQFPSFIFPSDGRDVESVDRQISYWRSQVRRQFLAKLRAPSKKPERAGLLFLASRTIRCAVTRMDPRLNSPSSLQSISVIRERIRERRPETRKRYSVFCTYFRRRYSRYRLVRGTWDWKKSAL